MRAVTWPGQSKVSVETVPDPRIAVLGPFPVTRDGAITVVLAP